MQLSEERTYQLAYCKLCQYRDVKVVTDQLLEILKLNRKDYFTRFERNFPEII